MFSYPFVRAKEPNLPHCRSRIGQSIQMYKCNTVIIIIIFGSICTEFLRLFTTRIVRVIRRNKTTEKEMNREKFCSTPAYKKLRNELNTQLYILRCTKDKEAKGGVQAEIARLRNLMGIKSKNKEQ